MKKLFTLALCMLSVAMPAFAIDIPLTGEGTEASPYLIQNKDDLVKLSQITCPETMNMDAYQGKLNCEGMFFKLMSDIDLEHSSDFNGLWSTINSTLATKLQFKGTFDGNGHTIHNMDLVKVTWQTKPSDGNPGTLTPKLPEAMCFIGRLGTGGTVKNLNIAADCKIEGYKYTGAIVGYSYINSTIDNCRNYADVTGYNQYVGGIAGWAMGTITNCYNAGNITGAHSYVGGIVGRTISELNRCANTGDILIKKLTTETATLDCAGGIAGYSNHQYGNAICDNLNTGSVTAGGIVGGISGQILRVSRCVSYGIVGCENETYAGAIGGQSMAVMNTGPSSDCFYDAQIITLGGVSNNLYNGVKGIETAELTSGTAMTGLDPDLWSFEAGMYPVLKQYADEPKLAAARRMVATLATGETVANVTKPISLASATGLTWSLNDGARFTLAGTTVTPPAAAMTQPDMLTATMDGAVKIIPIISLGSGVETGPFPGQGTEESPYLLSTKEDLIKLSQLTCTNSQTEAATKRTFAGNWFKLTNDIDLEYDEAFIGISVAAPYTLMNTIHFDGVIDGDGHTIHRMKINGIIWEVSPEEAGDGLPTVDNSACHAGTDYRSFVGRLGNGGIVRNLNIAADCHIVGNTPVGGIVAQMSYGSLVENCRNYADITAYNSQVGGIAGSISEGAKVTGCYNAGNILTGAIYAGGIAGNNDGTIEHCANTGDVTGRIINTNIPSGSTYPYGIGGIAGNATRSGSSISNCLNTGQISGEQEVGGMLGSFGMASYCMNYGIVSVANPEITAKLALSGNCFGNKTAMSGKIPQKLYYDAQINQMRAMSREDYSTDGIQVTIGLTTEELISGNALDGLDTELWQFDAGMYPVLKKFADEPKLNAARRIIARFAGTMDAFMLTLPVTLNPADGLTWSCDNHFKIDNGTAVPIMDGIGTFTATTLDGQLVKKFICRNYNTGNTAIDEVPGDKEVESTIYYNLSGVQVPEPAKADGQLYILLIRYTDGTSETLKLLNR